MKNEYSKKEQELIAYFGYSDISASSTCNSLSLYLLMVKKAFMNDDRTVAADSLRRCMANFGKIYRMTPEWDALIKIPSNI
jgi:hypothetical protein